MAVPYPSLMVKEAHRVLKRGAKAIFSISKYNDLK